MPSIELLSDTAVIPPSPPAENIWMHVFFALTTPPPNPSEFDMVTYRYRRVILADVIKRKWDSRFKVRGIPRHSKEEIQANGLVAYHLLELTSEVFLRYPERMDYKHPSIWFMRLFLEWEALGWLRRDTDEHRAYTKTAYFARFRAENQALWTLESNPFTRAHTARFFDSALDMARQHDQFCKTFRQYVSARRKLTTHLDKNSALFTRQADGSSSVIRQGRRALQKKVF